MIFETVHTLRSMRAKVCQVSTCLTASTFPSDYLFTSTSVGTGYQQNSCKAFRKPKCKILLSFTSTTLVGVLR
eukprot:6473379-Amphidinium_carterae.1